MFNQRPNSLLGLEPRCNGGELMNLLSPIIYSPDEYFRNYLNQFSAHEVQQQHQAAALAASPLLQRSIQQSIQQHLNSTQAVAAMSAVASQVQHIPNQAQVQQQQQHQHQQQQQALMHATLTNSIIVSNETNIKSEPVSNVIHSFQQQPQQQQPQQQQPQPQQQVVCSTPPTKTNEQQVIKSATITTSENSGHSTSTINTTTNDNNNNNNYEDEDDAPTGDATDELSQQHDCDQSMDTSEQQHQQQQQQQQPPKPKTEEERLKAKRERNRRAAANCRRRKDEKLKKLEDENEKLKKTIESLQENLRMCIQCKCRTTSN